MVRIPGGPEVSRTVTEVVEHSNMTTQHLSLLAILAFYALFLFVGIAARRREGGGGTTDELLLASRQLPLFIGVLTMVATWVGGGYLNGTAEAVADPARGMVWAQAPWGYAISLILGGIFFAGRMRRYGFKTLLDLFHVRYGKRVAAFLFIPALLGEVFWSAAILVALGTTFGTILGFDFAFSILLSAAIAITYTVLGGLRSVAYTDTLQLLFIVCGLGIALPFALNRMGGLNDVVQSYFGAFGSAALPWPSLSSWEGPSAWGWQWSDSALLLIFGGIPWQVYFQRVLACRDGKTAVRLSVLAGLGCFLLAIPAMVIGLIGATADWGAMGIEAPENPALVLPWVLKYLTPPIVATLGLAAIAAAVMSSVDSSILSASSMFTWNVYRPFWGESADDDKVARLMRVSVVGVGIAATTLALHIQSVYTLWFLCTDLVYVILFPQLILALFYRPANWMGAVCGAAVGFILRLGGGEAALGIPALLPYPMTDPELGVLFPFRTTAMLASLLTIIVVSKLTQRRCPATQLKGSYE